MKQFTGFKQLCMLVGFIGIVSGCSSGGDSGSGTGAGNGTAAASGTVTGFGSVFVNGKRFDTSGATFTVDGQSGSQGDLKLGMTVLVTGSMKNGQHSAASVRQEDAVEGLVQSVAADGLSMVVMSQTVLVDSTTLIDNNIPGQSILNVVAGTDSVEVNGYVRGDGAIQATFIERKLAPTPEVRGVVKNHNDSANPKTFQIGNLTVHYANAIINDMPNPAGNAWNGLFVEVKGTQFTPGPNVQTEGTLVATKVEQENQGVQQADEFEVEGFVTQVVGPGDFFIGTTHVQTNGNTEFRGGTIDEIVAGAKLSAEGRLVNGLLTAKHVKFHASIKLEGDIAAINLGTNTFTVTGLPGVTVALNSQTEFDGQSGNATPDLSDLSVGDHVRVRGLAGAGNSVIATRVEKRSADDDVDLQGPVQAVLDPNLTILGVSANTAAISDANFQGLDDSSIGRAAFFTEVKVGTLVKIQGRLNGGVITWREAELEDAN